MITQSRLDTESIRQELQNRAGTYFPSMVGRDIDVEVTQERIRQFSRVYRCRVRSGVDSRQVFVKVPVDSPALKQEGVSDETVRADRPRLVPLLSASFEAQLEHAALTDLADHFEGCNDRHLGVPRVLDILAESAVVVEAIDLPTLSNRLLAAHRFTARSSRDALQPAFRIAGSWLQAFHTLPTSDRSQERLAGREDVVALMRRFVDYLRDAGGSSRFLNSLEHQFERAARDELPEQLPLVCTHGDFGLHNLFVDADNRVLGFDTLAYWKTPLYEDLAYFLLLLDSIPPSFVKRSWLSRPQDLAAYRRAFLTGYFGSRPIPQRRLLLFDILVVLDKWVSAVHSYRKSSFVRAVAKRSRFALRQHMLRSRIRRSLSQLSRPSHEDNR
jgi:aminoglycoside phosphotransferase